MGEKNRRFFQNGSKREGEQRRAREGGKKRSLAVSP